MVICTSFGTYVIHGGYRALAHDGNGGLKPAVIRVLRKPVRKRIHDRSRQAVMAHGIT